jgi:threonine/homoserine/homoserine lactone efflux protein
VAPGFVSNITNPKVLVIAAALVGFSVQRATERI